MRYTTEILIKNLDLLNSSVEKALDILGFEPAYYDVTYGIEKKPKRNFLYNREDIFAEIRDLSKIETLTILKTTPEDTDSETPRFNLSIQFGKSTNEAIGNTFLLEWSNTDRGFLKSSFLYDDLLNSPDLVYCYQYNDNDTSKESYEFMQKGKSATFYESNPGRRISVRSLNFVAAASMYFGPSFSIVWSLEKLKKFGYSRDFENGVFIELFDINIYPIPRNIQLTYWDFLRRHNVIEDYLERSKFDFSAWIKNRKRIL